MADALLTSMLRLILLFQAFPFAVHRRYTYDRFSGLYAPPRKLPMVPRRMFLGLPAAPQLHPPQQEQIKVHGLAH